MCASATAGCRGVRALGLALASRRSRAQVSMNLVDLDATGLEPACIAVRDRARAARRATSTRVELVGLVPAAALAVCSAAFRAWSGISATETIEARVALRRLGRAAPARPPARHSRPDATAAQPDRRRGATVAQAEAALAGPVPAAVSGGVAPVRTGRPRSRTSRR